MKKNYVELEIELNDEEYNMLKRFVDENPGFTTSQALSYIVHKYIEDHFWLDLNSDIIKDKDTPKQNT